MIELTCTKCQAQLMLDDAFAGGVCRCQHCGTIQTVPSHAKRAAAVSAGAVAGKALYQAPGQANGAATLDDLAGAVTSSGLSSGRLRQAPPQEAAPAQARKRKVMLIVGLAAAVVVGVGLAALLMRHGAPDNADAQPGDPAFMGIKVKGPAVVFLIDAGSPGKGYFDLVRAAALKSVDTLIKTNIQVQLVFWEEKGDVVAVPEGGPKGLGIDVIEQFRRVLTDADGQGTSHLLPALTKALASHPDEIFLVTSKDNDVVDGAFAASVISAIGVGKVRIHTFSLNKDQPLDALATIAKKTGGQARAVSQKQLAGFSD